MDSSNSKFTVRKHRNFDPANQQDLTELGFFIKNKKWREGCPFKLEQPYENVPVMCMVKYAEHCLT